MTLRFLPLVASSILIILLSALAVASSSVDAAKVKNNGDDLRRRIADFVHGEEARWRKKIDSFAPVHANTTYGPIVGATGDGMEVFLGVPFAAPPTPENKLRWQPAAPHKGWTAPLETKWWRNGCVQTSKGSDKTWSPFGNTSEDCLYLNVYKPAGATKPLSVFFWLYGGSYAIGSSDFWYNPTDAMTKTGAHDQIAVVTINYRLNVMSSLCGTPLQEASRDGSCGTFGVSDQRAALQWVRDNAANFGFDVDRITVGGESAGAGSTGIFLTSPSQWPKFSQVIMESGPAAAYWVAQPTSESHKVYAKACARAGCPVSGNASRACLYSKTWEELQGLESSAIVGASTPSLGGNPFDLTWSPSIDGVVIDEHPRLSVERGRVANAPILAGTNMNETTLLEGNTHNWNITSAQFKVAIRQFFPNYVDKIFSLYNPATFSDDDNTSPAAKALFAATTDQAMFCPTRMMAIAAANNTAARMQKPQTFIYELRTPNYLFDLLYKNRMGVSHEMELPLVWYWRLPFLLDKGEQELGKFVVHRWYSFIATGNPNGQYTADFKWDPFTFTNHTAAGGGGSGGSDTLFALSLDKSSGTARGDNFLNWRRKKCEFWDNVVLPMS